MPVPTPNPNIPAEGPQAVSGGNDQGAYVNAGDDPAGAGASAPGSPPAADARLVGPDPSTDLLRAMTAALGQQAAAPAAAPPTAAPAADPAAAPAPTPTPAATTTSAPASNTQLRDMLAKQGIIDANAFPDDAAVLPHLQRLEQMRAQVPHLQAQARVGAEAMEHWEEFQKFRADRQKASAEDSAKQQQAAGPPKLPEYDANWENLCVFDETTGVYKVRPGYEAAVMPDTAKKLTEYHRARAKRANEIVENFDDLVAKEVQRRLDDAMKSLPDQIQQTMQQRTTQMTAREYLTQNAAQFYQLDANGQFQFDANNQPLLTPHGEALAKHVNKFERRGITDEAALSDVMLEWFDENPIDASQKKPASGNNGATPPAQAKPPTDAPAPAQTPAVAPDSAPLAGPTPAERNQKNKDDFTLQTAIRQAAHAPNRDAAPATVADAATAVPVEPNLKEMLMHDMKEAGLVSDTG